LYFIVRHLIGILLTASMYNKPQYNYELCYYRISNTHHGGNQYEENKTLTESK